MATKKIKKVSLDKVTGGIVKCGQLNKAYPNKPQVGPYYDTKDQYQPDLTKQNNGGAVYNTIIEPNTNEED